MWILNFYSATRLRLLWTWNGVKFRTLTYHPQSFLTFYLLAQKHPPFPICNDRNSQICYNLCFRTQTGHLTEHIAKLLQKKWLLASQHVCLSVHPYVHPNRTAHLPLFESWCWRILLLRNFKFVQYPTKITGTLIKTSINLQTTLTDNITMADCHQAYQCWYSCHCYRVCHRYKYSCNYMFYFPASALIITLCNNT
jgi:hypothetical protein